ncbi:hypothetical protein [Bacillus cereus group sp. BfR-BA-01523]|uniref:hypothetical protein n=1 Tax=Bacillus cereus group sp. BfR-BA-01523 TaxID=2920371 RepID=UPI001F56F91F|nr:hypothetical protein [Bacillus cereus group sp. BfR-BA-01523]
MKTKIFSIITALTLMTCFAIPTLAASSSYSFKMDYRVVDGSKNKQFHTLSKGSVYINGSAYVYSTDGGAMGPYDVKYTLYRSAWGSDPSYGTVNGGINKSFSGAYSVDTNSNEYYLFIWKTNDDGQNVKGNGKISN